MRSREDLRLVMALAADGASRLEVARQTGIPLTTVGRWLDGRPPLFDRPDARTCQRCGHPRHDALDGAAYCYLLGLYLGDGHVARFPRTWCLRVYLDARYTGIVAGCAEAIRRLLTGNRVAVHPKPGSVVVQCYSRQWPCLLPQHGPGRKHEREIELEPWQRALTAEHPRELVRGLLHSDGSRFTNRVTRRGRVYEYPRYLFSNRSDDIKRILCDHLDLLGIGWRRASAVNVSIARREAGPAGMFRTCGRVY